MGRQNTTQHRTGRGAEGPKGRGGEAMFSAAELRTTLQREGFIASCKNII